MELAEPVADGQRVALYRLDAHDGDGWREVARGTTIGYKRLVRIAPQRVARFRLTLEDWTELPEPVSLRCYAGT